MRRSSCRQSTSLARPRNWPDPLSAKWMNPRFFVDVPRISHVFVPANIKSNHFFLIVSAFAAHLLKPDRRPANIFWTPLIVFPELPGLPLAFPRLPGLPFAFPRLPGLPPSLPALLAPLVRDLFLKHIEHSVDRLLLALRPHTSKFLQLGIIEMICVRSMHGGYSQA